MNFLTVFLNTIYWVWLVLVPLIPASVFGLWLYDKSPDNISYIVLIGIVALILGVIWAESVRKRQGLITFFSKIMSSEDVRDINVGKRNKKDT